LVAVSWGCKQSEATWTKYFVKISARKF